MAALDLCPRSLVCWPKRGCSRSERLPASAHFAPCVLDQLALRTQEAYQTVEGHHVHLKSLTLKGFKSFPDRTRLDFGPGVSVVVGPNGSGKSNVTDAVLWAMGEQSPLAVRGQSMQDVIFGGGRGVQARSCAEVELVLDNSDGSVALPFSEVSILRRLHRSGEGEYRLNGARCRLGDVIEVLSDTGLGKETHSVISQGRVESIVLSKPRDRRLLIEEAAGLGKHRKRRRRAQLKLERTQENLDRALDVEREARTRLRPLKRQAEAAELHERLERQALEVRLALAREALRARRLELGVAKAGVQEARAVREAVEAGLRVLVRRRSDAERALAHRSERHDALARGALQAGAAQERLELRREQAAGAFDALAERTVRVQRELELLEETLAGGGPSETDGDRSEVGRRVDALEQELAALALEREQELEHELAELDRAREAAAAEVAELDAGLSEAREAREEADAGAEEARGALRGAERAVEAARREAARVGSELAAVNQFLRNHAPHASLVSGAAGESAAGGSTAGAPGAGESAAGGSTAGEPGAGGAGGPRTLSEALNVQPGYELALAAALGGRLDAALVPDLPGAAALLDRAGPDGATALLANLRSLNPPPADSLAPPAPGARPLLELVDGPPAVLALAQRLLTDAWVVERLEDLPEDFAGLAVTPRGRVWFASYGEVRQVTEGGAERVLARRNEREQLLTATEAATTAEHAARAAAEHAQAECHDADAASEEAEGALREAARDHARALEQERHAAWLVEQRRAAPDQGPLAVRRAQLEGELAAERRQAERVAREHAERLARLERLRAQLAADTTLAPLAERLAAALRSLGEVVAERVAELQGELARDRAAGEEVAAELRACAAQEADAQARLRAEGEAVTVAEVAAQRLRDLAADAELELRTVRERLELPAHAASPAPEGAAEGEEAAPEEEAGEGEDDGGGVQESPSRERTAAHDVGGRESGVVVQDSAEEGGSHELAAVDEEDPEPLDEEQVQALAARLERLRRRREQLGPVNPLAQEEYAEALAHVEELEAHRNDLETALRELRTVIRDTDRQIHETFHATFEAAARNFEELARDVFPGGGGRLRLVKDAHAPRSVLGGQPLPDGAGGVGAGADGDGDAEAAAELEEQAHPRGAGDLGGTGGLQEEEMEGVEIEITPAGKSAKRLSLLSGGEKSMTALAFLFAVFLARPCPFYILDEVEAALDDLNLERFLSLLRRYADRAQFIVITHQKRTMEAADWLYGVSMAGNGVSKVLSRRLPPAEAPLEVATVDATEPAGLAEQVDLAQPADLAESTDPAEPTGPPEPADLAEAGYVAAPADPVEAAEPVDLAEVA
jgi:chromosome segregation protein